MAIGSIGSTPSFWQQDQSYWSNAHNESAAQSADASLINVMAEAETNLGKGLASIANGEALTRTKSQLTSAIQAVLQGTSGSSTTTSSSATGSTTSSSGTSSSAASSPTPATGTGTVPLTTTTPLSTLGILPGGTFSIDDGTNITNYTSTGADTVASLISAINSGPAFVTASLNPSGHLTITARNTKDLVTVEGSGNDATALGFGTGNNSFTPKVPKTSSASTTSSPSSTSSTSSSTSKSSKSTSSSSSTAVSSIGEEISSSAASILSASGVSGTLVDMLA
jgi:hypothetical protein